MENKVVIPYSHHYRDSAMMMGKPVVQVVFEYLLDEYIYRMRAGKRISDIPYSKSKIAKSRNLDRETVDKAMSKISASNLVEFCDGYYNIDGRLYMALIKAFSSLEYKDRKQFTKLLFDGNIEELSQFGVDLKNHSERDILEMSGEISIDVEKPAGMWKNQQPCGKTSNHVENSAGMQKNPQVCGKIDIGVENSTTMWKNQQLCGFFHSFSRKFQEIAANFRENLWNFPQLCGFFNTCNSVGLSEIDIEEVAGSILDEKSAPSDEILYKFMLLTCGKIRNEVWKNPQVGVEKSATVNNNKEIKKEKSENEVLLLKEKKQESSFLEQDELDFNIPEQDEQDDEPLDFQVDTNMMGDSLNKYQLYKKKQRLPYFPASTVNEITSDIRNCLDRADKIFIHQVWSILHDMFDQDEYADEDGNMIPASNDVENSAIVKERLEKDIMFPALEETIGILERGTVELNGEELEVTAEKIPEEYYNLIIGWETRTILGGESYIVSSARIHDIYAEQISESPANVKTKRGNDAGRDDDYSYMQKIVKIGTDDSMYEKLTPIELAAYNLLAEYFQFSDDGEIVEPLESFLSEREFRIFIADIRRGHPHVTKEDLVSVIFNNKLDDGGVSLRNRMFSAQKIRNWNAKHGYASIVDEYEITQK